MRRTELCKAVKAAAEIAGENEFIVIGSQALHASCLKAPAEVLLSQECDLYPKNRFATGPLLQSKLGRGSPFARENGFFVDVVTPDLATLPLRWEQRLKPLRFGKATAFCLEVHDLLVSKLAAGRIKDREFIHAVFRLKLANPAVVKRRLQSLPKGIEANRLLHELKLILAEL